MVGKCLQRKFTIAGPDNKTLVVIGKGTGEVYLGKCPFCKNSGPIDLDLRVTPRNYSCHKCDATGDIIEVGSSEPIPIDPYLPTAANIIDVLKRDIRRNKEKGFLGIDPGFDFLKKSIKALIPSHLWVVGGYTSHGKTAFAVDLIARVTQKAPSANITLFSLEMSKSAYILRLVSNITHIPSLSILQGEHISSVQDRIDKAFEEVAQKKLIVFDDLYEFNRIAKQAKDIKEQIGLDILIIDFIQNIYGKGSIYERMSILSPKIQALAKELDCTIIALSQVSHEAINENLRSIGYKGAGEIAAAADLGIWLERDPKNDDVLRTAIRENRHGPLSKTILRFKDGFTWLQEESTQETRWKGDG